MRDSGMAGVRARNYSGVMGAMLFLWGMNVQGHQISFNSSMTYSDTPPTGAAGSVANWTGAAFDAANIGGSGVNSDGGVDNGTANDTYTYVANNQPVQGQSS